MVANTLRENIRQHLDATTESNANKSSQWTLDADEERIRQAIGVAFAGTEKVLGEPTWIWALQHCQNIPIDEKVHWVRYMMSFAFFDDLRQRNHFQLCSETPDGEISSLACVQEYDAAVKASEWFPKLRHGWHFFVDTLLLLTRYNEALPSIFKDKQLRQESVRLEAKMGDFEEKAREWHRQVLPKGLHWYVHMVGVSPDFQGQGHGKAIMQQLNRLADESDRILYLEAGERNRKFYEKMGFKVQLSKELVDPEDPSDIFWMHLMTREPTKKVVE